MLQSLLKTTERVVQEIDSVEYGLTDIQVDLKMASTQFLVLDISQQQQPACRLASGR